MDVQQNYLECPGCGEVFAAPNVPQITLGVEPRDGDGIAVVIRLDTWLRHRRHVLHECPTGGSGGDGALFPARPPSAPPTREASIALDLPGLDAT